MSKFQNCSITAFIFLVLSSSKLLADTVEINSNKIDQSWVLLAIALVALMQIGFLLLECGFVRSKTTINVAQKNLTDFVVSIAGYWLFGFSLMFGLSVGGWFGFSGSLIAVDRLDGNTLLFLRFKQCFVEPLQPSYQEQLQNDAPFGVIQ